MKILLTGGTGYIGSHTAVALLDAGHEVVIVDNLCNSQISALDAIERISGRRPEFVQGDIRDTALLKDVFARHAIVAVVHFAGLKAVAESVREPLVYFDNNVGGTLALLQAMDAAGVRKLVFSSSATVYGNPQYLPIDETHPTGAINPYGRTKLHIEQMLADLVESDPRWKTICLRYFNPVGAHASGLIGESPNGLPNNLMPLVVRAATGELQALEVYGDDYPTSDGTGVRDYIHVEDVAGGHVSALDFLESNAGWHALNLGTGTGHSVLELITAFQAYAGVPVAYRIGGRRAGDAAEIVADPGKAFRLLGWRARYGLDAMCSSAWKHGRMCRAVDA